VNAVSTPPLDSTGWRYPRAHPSLPESYHSIGVPKGIGFWRKALAFAVVPLVWFTSERRKMGEFVNGAMLRAVAWTVAFVIMGLNGWLLVGAVKEWVA
jgi:hypothetical protein